jgi:hypothetical protein
MSIFQRGCAHVVSGMLPFPSRAMLVGGVGVNLSPGTYSQTGELIL